MARTTMNATDYPLLEGFELTRAGPGVAYAPGRPRQIYACADGHVTFMATLGPLGGPALRTMRDWARQEGIPVPPSLTDVDFVELTFAELEAAGPGRAVRGRHRAAGRGGAGPADQGRAVPDRAARAHAAGPGEHGRRPGPRRAARRPGLLGPAARRRPRPGGRDAPRGLGPHGGHPARVHAPGARHRHRHGRRWSADRPARAVSDPARTGPPARSARAAPAASLPPTASPPAGWRPPAPRREATRSAGLRVWDMSWVGVGPLTTRYLADYGATVIRLDSSRRADVLRVNGPFAGGVARHQPVPVLRRLQRLQAGRRPRPRDARAAGRSPCA